VRCAVSHSRRVGLGWGGAHLYSLRSYRCAAFSRASSSRARAASSRRSRVAAARSLLAGHAQ
jgi:hypothetical protein